MILWFVFDFAGILDMIELRDCLISKTNVNSGKIKIP